MYGFFCQMLFWWFFFFFFFNDTATTEIYTLSLHDALPIYPRNLYADRAPYDHETYAAEVNRPQVEAMHERSEEHTSELQSRQYLVCRLLLEKKKKLRKKENQHRMINGLYNTT